jgi:Capsule assembly protein Wzi
MRRENWELVFTAVLALAFPVTLLRAQETSHGQTGEVASLSAKGSAARKGRSQIGKQVGSPYVELDSWIYPALDRLAALGYVDSGFSDTRPWTRMECARMVQQVGRRLDVDPGGSTEARRFYATLRNEFQSELGESNGAGVETSVRLESLYSRATGISGQALNDSYHFGQTIINNFGRPYQEGFNSYDGYSAYAVAGRFAIYTRGEFQHAPSAPTYPLSVRQVIAVADGNPPQSATPIPGVNQFRLLNTYVAANLAGWDVTFGKQSLWWAPNYGGALLFSDNAEPIYMARMSRTAPFELPWIFRVLGPMKWDIFLGKLSGNHFPPRPLVHGEKISFKPTKNLELSFSRTAEFAGVGRALTLGAIWHTYTSLQSSVGYPASQNPGERNGGFDFSYRIPGLRNWLTVYADAMSRDDPNPLDAPRRAAWNPGLYLAWIPHLPRLDFRFEAVNTNSPSSSRNGQFFYYEGFYHDLYTNKNNLIGDWVGREGMGFQAWSTYWFNPRNTIQFGYRHAKVANDFIPSGGTLNDGSVRLNWWLHDNLQFGAFVQYEKWVAPVLAPGPQTNWTSSVEITLWPNWSKRAGASGRIDHSPDKSP